jgi:hypothetical protein
MLLGIDGMTDAVLVEMGSHEHFCLGRLGTTILPILASHEAGIQAHAIIPSFNSSSPSVESVDVFYI